MRPSGKDASQRSDPDIFVDAKKALEDRPSVPPQVHVHVSNRLETHSLRRLPSDPNDVSIQALTEHGRDLAQYILDGA